MTCSNCGALVPVAQPGSKMTCPMCGSTLSTKATKKNPAGK